MQFFKIILPLVFYQACHGHLDPTCNLLDKCNKLDTLLQPSCIIANVTKLSQFSNNAFIWKETINQTQYCFSVPGQFARIQPIRTSYLDTTLSAFGTEFSFGSFVRRIQFKLDEKNFCMLKCVKSNDFILDLIEINYYRYKTYLNTINFSNDGAILKCQTLKFTKVLFDTLANEFFLKQFNFNFETKIICVIDIRLQVNNLNRDSFYIENLAYYVNNPIEINQ